MKRIVVSSRKSTNSRSIDEKSAPSVLIAVKDTKVTQDARAKDRFETHANIFDLELSVLDAYGLAHVLVFADDNTLVDEVDFSYRTVLSYSESFMVPLKLGKNRIRIDVANVEQQEVSRFLTVERRRNESTHVIAVSSPYQQSQRSYDHIKGWLDTLNITAAQRERYRNLVYLDQSTLPRQELMSAIELLSQKAAVNEYLQPVLFFSGRIERRKHTRDGEKYYLMLEESDSRYLRSTAIDLDDVLDLLGERAFVMLEYCDDASQANGDYRLPERQVKVSVYRCDRDRGAMSSRFVLNVEKSRSLADIVEMEKRQWEVLPVLPAAYEDEARPRQTFYY